jgi:hypothetical protein
MKLLHDGINNTLPSPPLLGHSMLLYQLDENDEDTAMMLAGGADEAGNNTVCFSRDGALSPSPSDSSFGSQEDDPLSPTGSSSPSPPYFLEDHHFRLDDIDDDSSASSTSSSQEGDHEMPLNSSLEEPHQQTLPDVGYNGCSPFSAWTMCVYDLDAACMGTTPTDVDVEAELNPAKTKELLWSSSPTTVATATNNDNFADDPAQQQPFPFLHDLDFQNILNNGLMMPRVLDAWFTPEPEQQQNSQQSLLPPPPAAAAAASNSTASSASCHHQPHLMVAPIQFFDDSSRRKRSKARSASSPAAPSSAVAQSAVPPKRRKRERQRCRTSRQVRSSSFSSYPVLIDVYLPTLDEQPEIELIFLNESIDVCFLNVCL